MVCQLVLEFFLRKAFQIEFALILLFLPADLADDNLQFWLFSIRIRTGFSFIEEPKLIVKKRKLTIDLLQTLCFPAKAVAVHDPHLFDQVFHVTVEPFKHLLLCQQERNQMFLAETVEFCLGIFRHFPPSFPETIIAEMT